MFDPSDPVENLRQRREVGMLLRQAGTPSHEANVLAILGAIAGTDGQALRQAARAVKAGHGLAFGHFCQLALAGGGQRIQGGPLAIEEAYASLAAMGYDPSAPPVAFHCVEDGCHARAHLMIDRLLHLTIPADRIRRVWAFAERAFSSTAPKLRPTDEVGSLLQDYAGHVVEWDYHVAAAVLAEGPGGAVVLRVLDPSLFAGPTDEAEWHRRTGTPLHLALTAQVRELGVAPTHPATGNAFPGGDYRPWAGAVNGTPSVDAAAEMVDRMTADATFGRPERPLPSL